MEIVFEKMPKWMDKMDNWPHVMTKVVIVFTALSFLTSGLLYFAIREFRICKRQNKKAEEMFTWPTIKAIAIKSEAIYATDRRGRYRHYTPKITYIYNLNNKDYFIDVNNEKYFYKSDEELKAKNDAEQLGKSIVEEGKKIQIYCNPKQPDTIRQ